MTDETKKLFEAPYKVCETRNGYNVICTNKLIPQLCWTTGENDANRLARLPELYDALMETVYYKCFECMDGLRHNIDMTREELVKNGCPKKNNSNVCIYVKHLVLVRIVRNGE